jgi:hypothetical protein
MAGSQTLCPPGGLLAATLAVTFLTLADIATAQNATPPLPPAGIPARSLDDIADSVTAPEASPAPMTIPAPMYYSGPAVAPTGPPVQMGCFDTAVESIFG